MSQKEVSRFRELASILKEDRKLTFVRPFPGGDPGDPGHGEDYPAATVYEKGNNVVFKYGDPGFDGVPSIVYVMRNKNIYNAIDALDKAGFPVDGDRIELDPEDEYAIDDLLDSLEAKGVVTMFNPETDIYTKKDVDKYNSYLPDDEQYEYEDLGVEESWHPDKEWDEEDDQEDKGQDYPSDEDLFGMSEDKKDSMNKLNEVRQFKKLAGLLKESHPANDMWYEDFEDGLKNLVHNKYISKSEFKYYMDALDHVDPMDDYGHMTSAHDAAKEFVDDLKSKGSVKEEWDSPYDGGADDLAAMAKEENAEFHKAAIQSASGDKISHTEYDDYDQPIYWSTKNPNVTYSVNDDDQIIKYNGETGERYPIGDLRDYDEPRDDYEPDTDADYEEPRDDFDMAGDDYNDGEFWESDVKQFKKIAGIKEDDYSEDPSSDMDYDSESGDTATMGNINEDEVTAHVTQEVQKLADELLKKGRIGPKMAKKVMDYVAKHAKKLHQNTQTPIQWFNAAAEATWKSKGHRRGTKISEDDMDNRADQDSKTQYGQGGILNL